MLRESKSAVAHDTMLSETTITATDVEVIKLAGSCEPRGPTQSTFPETFPDEQEFPVEPQQMMMLGLNDPSTFAKIINTPENREGTAEIGKEPKITLLQLTYGT